ncbi:MAG TPA: hypothetical protein VKZ53_02610 [Candidatus Angelobacter sp.]|nr:hypothetical protein [Candidatus Angelobacter sp.]
MARLFNSTTPGTLLNAHFHLRLALEEERLTRLMIEADTRHFCGSGKLQRRNWNRIVGPENVTGQKLFDWNDTHCYPLFH